jgi:hypothetical protein
MRSKSEQLEPIIEVYLKRKPIFILLIYNWTNNGWHSN